MLFLRKDGYFNVVKVDVPGARYPSVSGKIIGSDNVPGKPCGVGAVLDARFTLYGIGVRNVVVRKIVYDIQG